MKRTIFGTVIVMMFSICVLAQKNTWMLYGSGSYDNVNYTNNLPNTNNGAAYSSAPLSVVGWGADLGIGYELSNHIMIGLQGGYGKQEGINLSSYTVSTSSGYASILEERKYTNATWNAGVFCRYTSWLGKRFYVYGQMFFGKYGLTEEVNNMNANVVQSQPYYFTSPSAPEGNGLAINLFPAIGVNIIQGFGAHMDIGGISYTTYNVEGTPVYNGFNSSNRKHFNVSLGKQFSFGIHKIIGWKKFNKETNQPVKAG